MFSSKDSLPPPPFADKPLADFDVHATLLRIKKKEESILPTRPKENRRSIPCSFGGVGQGGSGGCTVFHQPD